MSSFSELINENRMMAGGMGDRAYAYVPPLCLDSGNGEETTSREKSKGKKQVAA